MIPIGKVRIGKKLKSFVGVTIHNTGNSSKGADANAHYKYLANNYNTPKVYGFHYAVDENETAECIPVDEIAEHTGKRAGNDTTVGIEICMNADGDLLAATNRAALLCAQILQAHGQTKAVWKQNVFQHNDWSGKDCPEMLRAGKPYPWNTFVAKVNEYLGIKDSAPSKPAPAKPSYPALARNLEQGMRGDDVKQAQQRLTKHNAQPGAVDGVFGSKTRAAVIAFQRARAAEGRNIGPVDGIVGQKTWAILWE